MSRSGGWTLVELFICIAIIALLTGVMAPSLVSARQEARRISCASAMRDIHQAMLSYSVMNDRRLPPFSFSDYSQPSLPVSGHWGGISQASDPAVFGRSPGSVGMSVNLWACVQQGLVWPSRMICPGAPGELQGGQAQLFPYTFKQSSYCLRFPYSGALFDDSPLIRHFYAPEPMRVYYFRRGGETVSLGQVTQIVPQVRTDRRYPIVAAATCGDGDYDVARDVMFADCFWWQDRRQGATAQPTVQGSPVRAAWCHGNRFNIAAADGAVHTVLDDGTVEANSVPAGGSVPLDGFQAARAERIWQFFDAAQP